jgi:hypothetical protein
MTNFKIKDDIFFSLEKSEGTMDFPRKFYAKKISGNEIKIRTLGSNEALLVDVWQLDNFTIDGVAYTDVHEAIVALQAVVWNEIIPAPPIDYTPLLEEIIAEIKNDDAYQLFEDTEGNVLFGKIDDDGVMKYYKPDGTEYTGNVKPYSRALIQTANDYCADGVPYTLIQLRDEDTKEVVATIWRNDNNLTESVTAPANATKGVCVVEDLTGKSCATPTYSNICNTADIVGPLSTKLDEIKGVLNTNSQAEQALLTSIDTKLDDLALIKSELVTANTKLTDIKTDTATINTNLTTVIARLDTQIVKLEDLKTLVTDTNVKLDTANATLLTISTDIATIKTDIATIKTDIADIKTGVQSIDTKLSTVITSLSSIETKLDDVVTGLETINTTLQTEFDQTQAKLDEIKAAIELKGSDCTNKVFTSDCDKQEYLDALTAIKDAINASATDYTVVLNSIDTKLNDLSLIKTELVTANTTLSGIKTDTTDINTNLLDVIANLDSQITLLTDIKAEAVAGNVKLEDIKALLVTIDANILTIKNDLGLIKTDISAIKASSASIDAKLTSVVDSLTVIQTKLDTIHNDLVTINSTLQTEFDQTQVKLDELKTALEFAQDTFQLKDCDGKPIGVEENILKVVQIAKQVSKICNTSDISDPIVEAINAQAEAGKKQDLLTWVAVAGNNFEIPTGKFSTISLLAAKGEFKIENTYNNFVSDLIQSSGLGGGSFIAGVEISADGVGTESGATDLPSSIDTRANAKDMNPFLNSYTITCVREGVLLIEVYKD